MNWLRAWPTPPKPPDCAPHRATSPTPWPDFPGWSNCRMSRMWNRKCCWRASGGRRLVYPDLWDKRPGSIFLFTGD